MKAQVVLDIDVVARDIITTPTPTPAQPAPSPTYATVTPSPAQPIPSPEPPVASKDYRYGGEPVIADRDADKPDVYKYNFVEEKVDYARQK